MIKKAFTLIELIFIIILIGILSSVAASYFRDDKLALATYQVLEHIRYTQHLAISQHKFTPKDTDYSSNNGQYHLARWQIRFVDQPGTPYILGYAVYSDADRNRNIDVAKNPTEVAFNPFGGESTIAGNDGKDGALMCFHNESRCDKKMNLYASYGINKIQSTCNPTDGDSASIGGKIATLSFDEKGRPYTGLKYSGTNYTNTYKNLLKESCNITLTHEDGRSSVITIYPETGYAEITKLE